MTFHEEKALTELRKILQDGQLKEQSNIGTPSDGPTLQLNNNLNYSNEKRILFCYKRATWKLSTALKIDFLRGRAFFAKRHISWLLFGPMNGKLKASSVLMNNKYYSKSLYPCRRPLPGPTQFVLLLYIITLLKVL